VKTIEKYNGQSNILRKSSFWSKMFFIVFLITSFSSLIAWNMAQNYGKFIKLKV